VENKLGKLYYGCKITEFWDNYHNRMSVLIKFPDGTKKIKFYSRFQMEVHLNRFLEKNEIVHHLDGNQFNDSIENLHLTTRSEHGKFHNLGQEEFTCPYCFKKFILKGTPLSSFKSRYNSGATHSGPFCSQKCSSHYSQKDRKIGEKICICPSCNTTFTLTAKQHASYRSNKTARPNAKGPFCSKVCVMQNLADLRASRA